MPPGRTGDLSQWELPFAEAMRAELEQEGAIFSSTSDTEVVLHKLARSRQPHLKQAIADVFRELEGAYSILILTPDSMYVVRDPRGFRPLCLGELDGATVVAQKPAPSTSLAQLTSATLHLAKS